MGHVLADYKQNGECAGGARRRGVLFNGVGGGGKMMMKRGRGRVSRSVVEEEVERERENSRLLSFSLLLLDPSLSISLRAVFSQKK